MSSGLSSPERPEMEIVRFEKETFRTDLFLDLYNKTFTAKADEAIIRQRYLDNPYDGLLMFAAVDGGRIVANYSAVPLRISVEGAEHRAALSLNTMTDPAYAGRGLFTELASRLYSYLEENGYSMIIGFPNNLSNRIFNTRLGWKTVYEIPTLKLDLDGAKPWVSDPTAFGSSFDGLTDRPDKSKVHICLKPEYIDWRYRLNREKSYRVLSLDPENWLIYQYYRDEINVTELCCGDVKAAETLIGGVAADGLGKGFRCVTTWSLPNTEMHAFLEKAGFVLSSPIRTFGLRCFDDALSETVYDWRNWHLQMGCDNTY